MCLFLSPKGIPLGRPEEKEETQGKSGTLPTISWILANNVELKPTRKEMYFLFLNCILSPIQFTP